ncbi:MAG: ADP-forming succinate--CoA ligase subunit beta [Candidatus Omnitrophica bacterium]|nr:ADP-forming succinate--CoA ligase subunit beta [Candidatus Omnitrophota bacterium]
MKLHEFQAKRLFADYVIPVPRGVVAASPKQVAQAYVRLKSLCKARRPFSCNVKAQIHAGGRGKAGGVLVASTSRQAQAQAATLLGKGLVTAQTGPEGLPVRRVLLDERIAVSRELYLAITIDRSAARPVVLASQRGGVDIETVAREQPQAIVRELVDPLVGLAGFQARRLQEALGLAGPSGKPFEGLARGLYRLFVESDASIVEINPLVETTDGRLLALDAKVVLDDNALFRQPALAKLRDASQEHPIESRAGRIGISYVGLDGNIGCLVNGAGLAMATNDIIKLFGGSPANFLDVGGGANVEQVTNAFRILLSDRRVRAIFVNIFGGIMRCDWIAQGLLNAAAALKVKAPIVVRLAGTNVEEGRKLLADTALPITSEEGLADAARRVVELASAK